MFDVQDVDMPEGWHQLKSMLLHELKLAANFHHCCEIASGLMHARLLGERVAREGRRFASPQEASGAPQGASSGPIGTNGGAP